MKIVEVVDKAATGFEPVNGGFADLSLNHLGTPPKWEDITVKAWSLASPRSFVILGRPLPILI